MSEPNQQLIDLIFHLNRSMRQCLMFDSEITQLTLLQLETLIFLKQNKSAQMREVAEHLHIAMPSATSLINTLASLNLIDRQNDDSDRRLVRLVLTKKGESLLAKAVEAKKERINKILNFMTQKDKKHMVSILETILERMKEENEK